MDGHGNIIEVSNLRLSFDDRTILDGISFAVPPKSVFVILGGSGCGKTTILRNLLGLIKPDSGSIRIFGQEITGLTDDELYGIRKRIGMVFQGGALFNSMTLGENVALPLEEYTSYPAAVIDSIVDWNLSLVGLLHAKHLLPAQLSGGMRKRASIARALSMNPDMLFFDEHTTGLDPVMAAELDEIILRLRRELDITVVVVTHDMTSIRRIADGGIMLFDGHIVAGGTLSELEASTDPRAVEFFRSHDGARNGEKKENANKTGELG